jgi:hypothetical protein
MPLNSMVWLMILDDHDRLSLGEGHLPTTQYLLSIIEGLDVAGAIDDLTGLSRDELAAHTMNAITRTYTQSRDYCPAEMPLETWVLGPAPDRGGQMADWFKHIPDTDSYRVMIHRSPSRYRGRHVELDIWHPAYRGLKIHPEPGRLEDLKHQASALLGNMLEAYSGHPSAPELVIRATGHPYCVHRDPGK